MSSIGTNAFIYQDHRRWYNVDVPDKKERRHIYDAREDKTGRQPCSGKHGLPNQNPNTVTTVADARLLTVAEIPGMSVTVPYISYEEKLSAIFSVSWRLLDLGCQ